MRNFFRIMAAIVLAVMLLASMSGVAVAAPGSITGHVYVDGTTTPIYLAHVMAYDWDTGEFLGDDTTSVTGLYSMAGLTPGSYRLEAEATGYVGEYYDNVTTYDEATPVQVADSTATPNIDFALVAGSTISGTVYLEDGTTPLTSQVAYIVAYNNVTGAMVGDGYSSIANGTYSVTTGTGAGTYRVMAEAKGYGPEYYDNVTTFAAATPVSVSALSDTPGIGFSLAQSGFISGHVYRGDGTTPIRNALITAYDNATVAWVAEDHSGTTAGAYYINLAPGSYRLKAEAAGCYTQWYDNFTVPSGDPLVYWSSASTITVGAVEVPDIDFSLPTVEAVSTDPATGITATGATLNGDLISMGAADNVTVYFMWGTTSGVLTNKTPEQLMTAPGTFYYDLGSLTPETPYYFEAWAEGAVSFHGVERPFTTNASPAVPPAVTTENATGVTSSSATLNGNLAALGTATSVTVSFEWGLTTAYGNTTTPEIKAAVGTFGANLTGLAPNATYHFMAKAVGDGEAYGVDKTFATPASPSVTTSAATSLTTTSATLNGNLTSLGAATSVSLSFEWGLTTSYGTTTTPEAKTATGTFSANLTDLTAKTTYHFRAKAVGNGATVYGDDATFTTSTIAPSVTSSAATSLGASSATLNGNLAALGTATTVRVSFQWGTTTSYGSETTPQSISAVSTFSANLTGLSGKTTYHFRAKAVDDGEAVYGDDMTFITTDAVAPVVSAVNSSDITKTSATITWTTDETATSQVEYGLTEEYGSTTELDSTAVTSHSVQLTDLKAGKTYHYRVISKDAAGNQAESPDATFETTAPSGGMPAWAIVITVLAAIGVLGGGAFVGLTRLRKK